MELKPEIHRYFAALIEQETGIQYLEANAHLLINRLTDLAKFLNFPSIDTMWADIQKNGLSAPGRSLILDMATNNETSFYRDPEVFEFFRNHFVLKAAAAKPAIRIWCAATSTGQEPYTLAMVMDQLKEHGLGKRYQIQCTDISERVLKQAAAGIYSQLEIQRGLPALQMMKYFDQVSSEGSQLPSYRAKAFLSAQMSFKRLNLLEPWPAMGPFDIVFCRNVLIYQNVENKKRVIERISGVLAEGGYLVLGGAESLLGLSSDYDMELHGKACVYRRKPRLQAAG